MSDAAATHLVTGATSGIGRAAAEQIALGAPDGSRLLLVARDRARGERAVEEISAACAAAGAPVGVELLLADLSSLDQVRRLAADVHERTDRLDVLVNNAGLVMRNRRLTPDGYEWTFAVNHLAPFLLTHLVLDLLQPGPDTGTGTPPRVVTTASGAMSLGRIDVEDLMYERRHYTQFRAYCSSKLANVLFAAESARRWPQIWSVSAHPGGVNTRFGNEGSWWLRRGIATFGSLVLRTPEEGAAVLTWAALSPEARPPEVPSGSFVADAAVRSLGRRGRDKVLANQLWEESLRLTGLG